MFVVKRGKHTKERNKKGKFTKNEIHLDGRKEKVAFDKVTIETYFCK